MYVQRCYEAVVSEETKLAIEKEMKEVQDPPSILPRDSNIVDNNAKSTRWFIMVNKLGYHASPSTTPVPRPHHRSIHNPTHYSQTIPSKSL
jgi:hypothetical protein